MKNESESKSARGRRYSEAERRHHLEQYVNSGMSAKAYALKHGMSAESLMSWKKRYAGGASFVPVKVSNTKPGINTSEASVFELSLRRADMEVRLKSSLSDERTVVLLKALKQEVLGV